MASGVVEGEAVALRDVVQLRQRSRPDPRNRSPRTVNNLLTVLTTLLKVAVDWR